MFPLLENVKAGPRTGAKARPQVRQGEPLREHPATRPELTCGPLVLFRPPRVGSRRPA